MGGQRAADRHQHRAPADHSGEIGEFARARHLTALARILQALLRGLFGAFAALLGFGGHQRTPAAGAPTSSPTAVRALLMRLEMPAMMPSTPAMSTKNPQRRVMVNPMPNRLSCGAARETTPRARLTITRAITAGSAIRSPDSNTRAPHRTIDTRKFLSMCAPPIGSVRKLWARVPSSTRCPLIA